MKTHEEKLQRRRDLAKVRRLAKKPIRDLYQSEVEFLDRMRYEWPNDLHPQRGWIGIDRP